MTKITVGPYKAGTVNHVTNNEKAKNMVDRSILGWYGQPSHDEWNGKDYWHYNNSFGTCTASTNEDRLKNIRLARKMPCKIHY